MLVTLAAADDSLPEIYAFADRCMQTRVSLMSTSAVPGLSIGSSLSLKLVMIIQSEESIEKNCFLFGA
jgi:hypothetical protein